MDAILLQILNGLDKGSAYALIALGLTLIFGTLGVVNFAHGALFMIGAFCSVTLSRSHPTLQGASWRYAVPLSPGKSRSGKPARGEPLIVFDDLGAGEGAAIAVSEGAEASAPFGKNFLQQVAEVNVLSPQIENPLIRPDCPGRDGHALDQ